MSAALIVTLALIVSTAQFADAQSQFTAQNPNIRFQEMDRNKDRVVTRAEWQGSEQSFRTNDWNGDGILSGEEVRPGAVRSNAAAEQDKGIWDDREDTFENLDVNKNGRLERGEWHGTPDSFEWLDRNRDGLLSRGEVVGGGQAVRKPGAGGARRRWDAPPPGSAPSAQDQQNCTSSAPQVVDDIFKQVLERPADAASAGMTQELAAGRATVRDIVAQVAKSEEHAQRFFWQPIVSSIYKQMLKRDPSAQELRDSASELASGQRQLPEVIARMARRASSNDEGAVRILYRRLLGRRADPDGLRGFTEQARREGIESVAREMVASAEYKSRGKASGTPTEDMATYEAAVRSLYRHVLGRDPDPEGLRDLTQIAAASGFNSVVDRMVGSTEYEGLFGTNVVPGRAVRYCAPTQ